MSNKCPGFLFREEGEAGFKPRLKLDVVVEAHPHGPVGAGAPC